MKLLITGASGFIGTHLVERLHTEGHELHAIIRPSTDISSLTGIAATFEFSDNIPQLIEYIRKKSFDGVIHMASLFLGQHTAHDVVDLVHSNISFPTQVLEAACACDVPWFVNTGTLWQHYQNKTYSPANLYAASKQAFEDMAKYYRETSETKFVTVEFGDTFGPGDTRPKVFSLWNKISLTGEELGMSEGRQLIDLNYVENVVDGYVRIIELLREKKISSGLFSMSSGRVMTLRKLAKLFEKTTGRTLHITWGERPYRPREVMIPYRKGKRIPGWKPKVTLEEGIRKTIGL